ncbi:MAG: hypothetical protein QOD00_3052 [Blastocatellia bacterium]|jgi:hypothetical protein|nr:hypothetical protein [Blastocatellia bacterium]
MHSKYILMLCLGLCILCSGPSFQAQRSSGRPERETRANNYYDLLEKYEAAEKRREREPRREKVAAEDQFEMEFMRWNLYWRDHLLPNSEPGTMADMSLPLRQYFMAAQRTRRSTVEGVLKGAVAVQTSPLVCPSTGLGNWTSMGPSTYAAPIMGRVTSVYVDPSNPDIAYAGSDEGGLFKTVNNGASWTNLTDYLHYPSLGITSIAVQPNTSPATIYIGTKNGGPGNSNGVGGSYGFGILKSTNGGVTWNEVFALANYNNQTNYHIGQGAFVTKVMLHPQDPNTVYALASHFVFRSTDAGATWQKVMEIVTPSYNPDGCGYMLVDMDIINGASGVADSKIMVSTIRTAWMGVANSPCGTARAFLSTTGGAMNGANSSFNEITAALVGSDYTNRIAVTVQPGNSTQFFIGYESMIPGPDTGDFIIKKYNTVNNGVSLAGTVTGNGTFGLGAGYWNVEMEFSKLNSNTLYVAGTTLYRMSLAGGFSYAQISEYYATDPNTCQPYSKTHADIRAMTVSKSGPNDIVLIGTDGGPSKATLDPSTPQTYATANWHDMTGAGLALNEFFDVNGIESDPNMWVGGTVDNGMFEADNGNWRQRHNGDGWKGTINQATGEYYGMTNVGSIKGMTGTAGTFNSLGFGPALGLGPVVSDPNNPSVIYGGDAYFYKSTNFGGSWNTSSPPGTTGIRAIHVAPSDSNRIYVSRGVPTWNANDLSKRLFRSSNGGNTWTDIGVNLPVLAWLTVSDIAVDPDDANRLWVCFNGYWPTSSTSIGGVARVYYSGDGGNSWTDFTYNLLAFPVATIVYRRGSDDELYAGTDVGVFRYNKSLHSWECFNNLLPVVPVTRLRFNYCQNKLIASTWGRGIYQSDLAALPSEVVNTSVTWSGVRYLSNNLTIAPGATLNITGTLYMSKDTVISVQRGATLNLNGGVITNACGEMWHGIEVWGTKAAAQNLAGAQGKVIMQNAAKIENALEAITTGRTVNNSLDPNYTGGIVQATNSSFFNNRRSVAFLSYHWMNGTFEMNNQSYLKNCTFETNRLLNDATVMPYVHVSLEDVHNLYISGCKFNNTTSTAVFGVNDRGNGVVSNNAQYEVNDMFNPIIYPAVVTAPSVFNGLTYGVRADFPAASQKKVTIANSDFNNVQRGVQVFRSTGSSVISNSFNALPNSLATTFHDATWGVRMVNASNLSVNSNTLTGASAAYQNNYGVIIDNCGPSAGNLVKGNTLKNLYGGIRALGLNGTGAKGVKFKCNIFQPSMAYQLSVDASGTLSDQGTACTLGQTADNTFFPQAIPAGSQIDSGGAFFYYYASGTVPTNVTGPLTVLLNNCSNTVSGECNAKSPDIKVIELKSKE